MVRWFNYNWFEAKPNDHQRCRRFLWAARSTSDTCNGPGRLRLMMMMLVMLVQSLLSTPTMETGWHDGCESGLQISIKTEKASGQPVRSRCGVKVIGPVG